MKVTTKQPEPVKPNVVIELTPEEAADLAMYVSKNEAVTDYPYIGGKTVRKVCGELHKLGFRAYGE